MSTHHGFAEFLKPRLPLGCDLRVCHVSAKPASCPPLFAAAPGQVDEETWCESHFLVLSQAKDAKHGSEENDHIIVFGIEVLIFTSQSLTTVFVSKADSTGFVVRQGRSARSTSIAQAATATFLEFLVQPRRLATQLVLSLFARSQNQYLFPGSIENATKHVLDDRQLIKWWCRVLDTLMVRSTEGFNLVTHATPQAFVVVPGCDKTETKAFFPPPAQSDSPANSRWTNEYPVETLALDASLPPRCLVPRLPDDPKSRFLDDLDESQVDEAGRWRGVKTLDQFWELMSYRQECSAGRLVGFVWLVFAKAQTSEAPVLAILDADKIGKPGDQKDSKDTLEIKTADHPEGNDYRGASASVDYGDSALRQDSTTDADTYETKTTADSADKQIKIPSKPLSWPVTTRGQVVLSSEKYSTLMDHLLQLDFAGERTAAESTTDWVKQAMSLSGQDKFGVQIVGQLVSVAPLVAQQTPTIANIITTVRKKRKANTNSHTTAELEIAKKTQRADELILEVDSQDAQRKKVKS